MSYHLEPTNGKTELSPFDNIKRTTNDTGQEYWSARDLMPLMGYGADWRNLLTALDRAKATAQNTGDDVECLFVGVTEKSGGRPREDFHLTRYAAYLLAMNGDPRKPETAAAQAYFAIRTREAEVAAPRFEIPQTYAAALRCAADATERAEEAEKVVAELAPKAEAADKFLQADQDYDVADAAKILTRAGVKTGRGRLFKDLEARRWIYRHRGDGRWRVRQEAIDAGYMSVLPQSHYHPKTGVLVLDPPQPRVTFKGIARIGRDYGARLEIAS